MVPLCENSTYQTESNSMNLSTEQIFPQILSFTIHKNLIKILKDDKINKK